METIKVTKKMLRMTPGELLIHLKAVEPKSAKEPRQAFPSYVYISSQDYTTMKKNSFNYIKKKRHLTNHSANLAVGMEFLNLGPNELEGLKKGYILVDRRAINKEIEELEKLNGND